MDALRLDDTLNFCHSGTLRCHQVGHLPYHWCYKVVYWVFVEITDEQDQQAYNIADTTPSAEDELITEQNLSRLLQFIKELKPHYQEVIQLRYFQEMSYQEIANKIDEPLSNVKIKLLRAKKLLAEIIQNKR